MELLHAYLCVRVFVYVCACVCVHMCKPAESCEWTLGAAVVAAVC